MKAYIQNKSLPLWISKKFIKDSIRTKYSRVIVLTTILGLTIGIAILLSVLSVMNGFTDAAKTRFISLLPHLSINIQEDYDHVIDSDELIKLKDYQESPKIQAIKKIITNKIGANKIKDIYPSFQTKAFIINGQKLAPISIISVPTNVLKDILKTLGTVGTDGKDKLDNKSLEKYVYIDKIDITKESEPDKPKYINQEYIKGIFISSKISDNLHNKNSVNFALTENLYKFYNTDIVSIFNANDKFIGNIAVMDLHYAMKLFPNSYINKINTNLKNPAKAPVYNNQLLSEMTFTIENWTQYTGNYFNILEYTKQIMFILLSCIIIVAMFNAVASLSTTLNEKQSEIAILKTIGGKSGFLIQVFLIYGFIITTIGLILGLGLGYFLTSNISYFANIIESILGYKLINPQIYFINYLPAKIDFGDIFNITAFVYILMGISLIIPIRKSINQPASQILRHL